MMKKKALSLMSLKLIVLVLSSIAWGQQSMPLLIQENFDFARDQYKTLAKHIPADKMPQNYNPETGKIDARNIEWWCSGFYPGSLWLIYEQTKDPEIHQEALRALKVIEPNKTFTGNHDLGFMMYCSFGNAYRITGERAYKDVLFQSAKSLTTRYRPTIRAIQSWDKNKYWECPVIIDNMMNLEMLNWVSDNGGDKKFKDLAIIHSNTTLKNHFRSDYSSYHVVDYHPENGTVNRKATWQGAANTSSWARGQGWALYGFTMMYRDTRDEKYLKQAEGIAKFILNHPNLPEDKIPYWDFDAPLIPFAVRDASAGALIASALLELGQYVKAEEKQWYVEHAEKMIRSLASNDYRSKPGENGGFLLTHSTGALPLNSEIDIPIIYADYYFLEALKRYKDWYL
ncbi:glycoside hydrolase family 88 protein [Olivibacter sp. SDN3]|uniref:glycoside hydrolase family 88 protein n=1 Tax=Olivibacter sp. SDN3 TaxID=2764720 RepID=UPI002103AF4C|nr:glycoside hydrolase family 88 protein [Olivibacter sp. SDN3]